MIASPIAQTPLCKAVERGTLRSVEILLSAGADPNRGIARAEGSLPQVVGAPLLVACALGKLEVARLLIKHQANVHAVATGPPHNLGWSALHLAA